MGSWARRQKGFETNKYNSVLQAPDSTPALSLQRRNARRHSSESSSHYSAPSEKHEIGGPFSSSLMSSHTLGRQEYYQVVIRYLKENGLLPELLEKVSSELKNFLIKERVSTGEQTIDFLSEQLKEKVQFSTPIFDQIFNHRVLVVVGPTGVGKTTTIAKLAHLIKAQGKSFRFLSVDSYKIAAAEHLETYADLFRVPFDFCPTKNHFVNFLSSQSNEDVVIIDTAGYGPRDQLKMAELERLIHGIPSYRCLCVSATTNLSDLKDILNRYQCLEPDSLLVTKLDESSVRASVLNMAHLSSLPLSYVTTGQRVPEDILRGCENFMVNFLLKPLLNILV